MQTSHITESEFEALFFSDALEEYRAGNLEAKVLMHCQECSNCANLKDRYSAANQNVLLLRSLTISSRNDCPPESVWLEVSAGIMDDDRAMKLLSHASQCRLCTQRLTLAQDYLSDQDIEMPGPLRASSPEWQALVARQMAARLFVTREQSRKRSARRIVLWAASSVAASLLLGALLYMSTKHQEPKIESMLAQAYQRHRTIELRVPGASYAQLHQRRSGGQESIGTSWDYLHKPEEAINLRCNAQVDDEKCLLYRAQLNLLDWRYEPALASLNRITQLKSEEVLLARALALFEKAQVENESGAGSGLYAEAIEDLTAVLRQNSRNRVALFNRALIYQKSNMPENASTDWRALLELESDPGWQSEAKKNLELIEEKKKHER